MCDKDRCVDKICVSLIERFAEWIERLAGANGLGLRWAITIHQTFMVDLYFLVAKIIGLIIRGGAISKGGMN